MQVTPTYRCSKCDSEKPLDDFPPSKATHKGQWRWCRRCLRVDQRRIQGLKAVDRVVACRRCSVEFQVSDSRALFCSRKCKDQSYKEAAKAERESRKPVRACVWCGTAMPKTMRADAKFCSSACNEVAHRRTRNYRRRQGADAPRRPHEEPLVRFIDIAERDKWLCRLCGGRVGRRRSHPDPLCASLDHIVPLSAGGDNEPTNLQLAHLRCNLSKGAGSRGEQLMLL